MTLTLAKKLRQINPDPRHRHNHHQWLREYGRDKLHRQLGGVIAIMKDCRDMDEFRRRFDKVFAQYPQLELDLDERGPYKKRQTAGSDSN